MEHHALDSILILLAISVVAVALFRRLQLPPILGYLSVGVLAGPHAMGWLTETGATHFLGEIGVVFLLFTIGLEFSIPQFLAMRRTLLGLGGMQVLVGTLSGGLIAWAIGIPWQAALIVGGALSMSSTAIVIKQLTDQLELQATHGRLALGILLFQDLAAVPFLVMIPILAGGEQDLALPLLLALLKGVLALGVMLALGHFALRPLFHEVARARSAELFTLTVLLVSLAAAWITALLGLSLALGAFLAGMMLSETEYRHQVETDIRPFRDVLLGLFFITVGMQLDLRVLPSLWPWIALLVLGLVLGKGPLIVLLTRVAGYDWTAALRTGTVLAHGGEFGFALLALALSTGLLDAQGSQPILAAVVITMVLAPILVRHNGPLAARLFHRPKPDSPRQRAREIAAALPETREHVIICGFGRAGQNMASFLRDETIPYVALDMDPGQVKTAWEAGERVYFGDASHREILEAAGLHRARALVISFDHLGAALKILHTLRDSGHALPVLVRTRDGANLGVLLDAGATEVVPETLEASLMLGIQLLHMLGVPMRQIIHRMRAVRGDRYQLLQVFFQTADQEPEPAEEEHSTTIILPVGAYAVGRRLEELELDRLGVLITALHSQRGGPEAPAPDRVLAAGDVLALHGAGSSLQQAEARLLGG